MRESSSKHYDDGRIQRVDVQEISSKSINFSKVKEVSHLIQDKTKKEKLNSSVQIITTIEQSTKQIKEENNLNSEAEKKRLAKIEVEKLAKEKELEAKKKAEAEEKLRKEQEKLAKLKEVEAEKERLAKVEAKKLVKEPKTSKPVIFKKKSKPKNLDNYNYLELEVNHYGQVINADKQLSEYVENYLEAVFSSNNNIQKEINGRFKQYQKKENSECKKLILHAKKEKNIDNKKEILNSFFKHCVFKK